METNNQLTNLARCFASLRALAMVGASCYHRRVAALRNICQARRAWSRRLINCAKAPKGNERIELGYRDLGEAGA